MNRTSLWAVALALLLPALAAAAPTVVVDPGVRAQRQVTARRQRRLLYMGEARAAQGICNLFRNRLLNLCNATSSLPCPGPPD